MYLKDTVQTSSAVTIGTFDGLHLGHRALLQRVRKLAQARGLTSLVLTFPRPPQNYLGRPKKLLMPSEKRIALLKPHVDRVSVLEFPEIQPLPPQQFVVEILKERLRAAVVVIGPNFCFGRDRQGTAATLRELGNEVGIEVQIVDPVIVDGEIVSSTAIREALQAGDIERTARFLGDAPRLWGRVIQGEGYGRRLGFPTANLAIDPEIVLPAEGIYAARVICREKVQPGAFYIGCRPTLNGAEISIEIHMLDLDKQTDLYGEELEVQLLARLRGDQRFHSLAELQEQIHADIEAVRAFLAR